MGHTVSRFLHNLLHSVQLDWTLLTAAAVKLKHVRRLNENSSVITRRFPEAIFLLPVSLHTNYNGGVHYFIILLNEGIERIYSVYITFGHISH